MAIASFATLAMGSGGLRTRRFTVGRLTCSFEIRRRDASSPSRMKGAAVTGATGCMRRRCMPWGWAIRVHTYVEASAMGGCRLVGQQ